MPIHAIHAPTPALLFFALLWNEATAPAKQWRQRLAATWGEELSEHAVAYFPMAKHYEKEMGAPLERALVFMRAPQARDVLLKAKQWAMAMEEEFAIAGKRPLNIDPGLLALDQVTLISTKPYAHRIFVADNLYVELVYTFAHKQFRPMDWAYPDYREQAVIDVFQQARGYLLAQRS